MEINAGRNNAMDVIIQSIMNKEEKDKKRPSFSTVFDKLNKKKLNSKKPLNTILTQEQLFRYYLNDTEPLLKVSNEGFLQNLDLFGGSDINSQFEMIKGRTSTGNQIRGREAEGMNDPDLVIREPEGFNDPDLVKKRNEIEPKIIDGINDPEIKGYEVGNNFLNINPLQSFNILDNNLLRIPPRNEYEDALEENEFLRIYGEQPKLEDLIKSSDNYLKEISPFQLSPFPYEELYLKLPSQQTKDDEIDEEAGMDIPEEGIDIPEDDLIKSVLGDDENIYNTQKMLLEPEMPKGGLNEKSKEWLDFRDRVIKARSEGSTKTYRPNVERFINKNKQQIEPKFFV